MHSTISSCSREEKLEPVRGVNVEGGGERASCYGGRLKGEASREAKAENMRHKGNRRGL